MMRPPRGSCRRAGARVVEPREYGHSTMLRCAWKPPGSNGRVSSGSQARPTGGHHRDGPGRQSLRSVGAIDDPVLEGEATLAGVAHVICRWVPATGRAACAAAPILGQLLDVDGHVVGPVGDPRVLRCRPQPMPTK